MTSKDMREALEACESWMDRWTWHVGSCEGGDRCTCGRTAILHEARAALSAVPDPVHSENHVALPVANESAVPQPHPEEFDFDLFENAAERVARQLASFRLGLDAEDPFAYNEHEKLEAGHLIGSLYANGYLKKPSAKAVEEITSLEAAPSQRGSPISRTEGEWRPIETAPKDGDDILCWGSALGIIVVQWDADCASSHGGEYPWLTLDGPNYAKDAFTHWMPLPSPPGEQQPDPEESIRTRLDNQHVKSSGGVRTSI